MRHESKRRYDRARSKALKDLAKRHPEEFRRLMYLHCNPTAGSAGSVVRVRSQRPEMEA